MSQVGRLRQLGKNLRFKPGPTKVIGNCGNKTLTIATVWCPEDKVAEIVQACDGEITFTIRPSGEVVDGLVQITKCPKPLLLDVLPDYCKSTRQFLAVDIGHEPNMSMNAVGPYGLMSFAYNLSTQMYYVQFRSIHLSKSGQFDKLRGVKYDSNEHGVVVKDYPEFIKSLEKVVDSDSEFARILNYDVKVLQWTCEYYKMDISEFAQQPKQDLSTQLEKLSQDKGKTIIKLKQMLAETLYLGSADDVSDENLLLYAPILE